MADAETVRTYDLATLKPADAARLDGKPGMCRVFLDGPAGKATGE
jgi:hypothetical protein